jgi:hypothetical protein
MAVLLGILKEEKFDWEVKPVWICSGTKVFASKRNRRSELLEGFESIASPAAGGNEIMVGAVGFEPTTFWSQTRRATKLRYAPMTEAELSHNLTNAQ